MVAGVGVGPQGSNSRGSQVGRLIGRGFLRESGILAGTWFYRDPVTLDCRGEPEVFKSCFSLCTPGICVHCWSQEGKEEHSGGKLVPPGSGVSVRKGAESPGEDGLLWESQEVVIVMAVLSTFMTPRSWVLNHAESREQVRQVSAVMDQRQRACGASVSGEPRVAPGGRVSRMIWSISLFPYYWMSSLCLTTQFRPSVPQNRRADGAMRAVGTGD